MAITKNLVIYGVTTNPLTWITTPTLAGDALTRWGAVRAGGGADELVFTYSGHEYHIDLARVTMLVLS